MFKRQLARRVRSIISYQRPFVSLGALFGRWSQRTSVWLNPLL